jgi:hypothetical protein
MQVAPQRPAPHETESLGQVIQFPRRPGLARHLIPAAVADDSQTDAADDFACYEQEQNEPIDDRQRMLMNIIALTVVTLLVGAGVWIAGTIADMDRDQDCVMQGRTNCAPITAPARR